MAARRALHYVIKVGDRHSMMDFLKGTLGMKVLRHEEFDSGCKASTNITMSFWKYVMDISDIVTIIWLKLQATCNGPYQNKWSKTMIGMYVVYY